jgi:predicted nucleic acid-binding protein
MSHRKSIGHPFRILDGQIAAIALAHNASLATRNMRDFSDCDLDLINPFQ